MRLKGKNAVITGAASGVGRASSLLFAREGASIACVDIDAAMGEETAAMVRKEGGEAIFLASDESSYMSGSIVTLDGGRTGLTPGTF